MPKSATKIERTWIVNPNKPTVNWSDNSIYHTRQWRNDRDRHIKANPLCVICLSNGITTASSVSDHIKEISQGGDVWDWDNRQALCTRCHNRKTQLNKK